MARDQGRFVWFELVAKDHEKARAFYPELFGWKLDSFDMPGGESYPMLKVGDTGVGGFMTPPKDGIPPHWVSYVSVDDVDATAKKIEKAGGKALMDAFDVAPVGRMQPVADPEGGTFMLFRPQEGDPSEVKGPGAFHWNELWAKDPKAALDFYSSVLGYTHESMKMPNGDYHVLKTGETARGGLMQSPSSDVPTMWLQYVEVEDCDATVSRAKKLGGSQVGNTMEVDGVGRFAIIKDPLGGVIGVIKPAQS